MSGNLKQCCCQSPTDCDISNVQWNCSAAQTIWRSYFGESIAGRVDASSRQGLGPYWDIRFRPIYRRGSFGPAQLGSPVYAAGARAIGTIAGVSTQRLSDAVLTNPTESDADLDEWDLYLSLSAEWEWNRWESYGGFGVCGCDGFSNLCCDREIITYERVSIAPTSDTEPKVLNSVGRYRYLKSNPLHDPLDGIWVSSPLNPYGCMTNFIANGLYREADFLRERKVVVYEDGELVSDTGWETAYQATIKLREQYSYYRIGNQHSCNSFWPLGEDKWIDEFGVPFASRVSIGIAGNPDTYSIADIGVWLMDQMAGRFTGGLGGADWEEVLNEIGAGSEIKVGSIDLPAKLPYREEAYVERDTWGNWDIDLLSYGRQVDASQYNLGTYS